ncbi:MAG: tRNA threonylcarbamoyladenosine biosynthesis protein RimN [Gammaproteobacteria bacterium]|nr:MAG: tRNA threonylcarbamoyladenosine biosynthesis protein RimN [Gammaproteobacteria bacterium]
MTLDPDPIQQAVKTLQAGGIIAYPTEAVFGLGCDPQNLTAVQQLLDIKSRDAGKGLIIIASDISQLQGWVDFKQVKDLQQLVDSWPGPETWLVPALKGVSRLLRGEHDTLAVRVSNHPIVQQLCQQFNGAITSTSANKNGQVAAKEMSTVRQIFNQAVDCYVPGDLSGNHRPSRIRNAVTGQLLRE